MRQAYELHFKMKHRNTVKQLPDKKISGPLTQAQNTAKHIRGARANNGYVGRDAAREDPADLLYCHRGKITNGKQVAPLKLKRKISKAIAERAKKHRSNVGVRVSDTFIVSLPNDASDEECREMAGDMIASLVGDSEAMAMAAIHSDKERNKHLHIIYVDGAETKENALARNPEAKRVRRRDYGQLNVKGKPKELRASFAKIINDIGDREGRRFAEHRTLKERGIERKPQTHEGQEVQDKIERGDKMTNAAEGRIEHNKNIIAENIAAEGGTEMQQFRKLPKRWRLPQFFDSWRSKLGGLMKRHQVKKEAAKLPANDKENRTEIFNRSPTIQTFVGPDKVGGDVVDVQEIDENGEPSDRSNRTL